MLNAGYGICGESLPLARLIPGSKAPEGQNIISQGQRPWKEDVTNM